MAIDIGVHFSDEEVAIGRRIYFTESDLHSPDIQERVQRLASRGFLVSWSRAHLGYYNLEIIPGTAAPFSNPDTISGHFYCHMKSDFTEFEQKIVWSVAGKCIRCGTRLRWKDRMFGPKWHKICPSLGMVKSETNQSVLVENAKSHKDSRVRTAAVEKLVDQKVLSRIALEDKDGGVRRAAIEQLADQAVLSRIALEDASEDNRRTALGKITNQTLLRKVVIEARHDAAIQRAFLDRLTDQSALGSVVMEVDDWLIGVDAVKKIYDQTTLSTIAVRAKNGGIRYAAVERLTDRALLQKIANEDKDTSVQLAASLRISRLVPGS